VTGNSDLNLTVSAAGKAELERFIQPFRQVIGHANGLMMSNIVYKNLDSLPAVLSTRVVGQARQICGDKLIITDDLWAVSVRQVVAPGLQDFKTDIPDTQFTRLVEMTVMAGNDMLLITHQKKVPVMIRAITQLVARDANAKKKVDEAVLRILKLKQQLF
jgi:beta-glucosidase-like glycosyl hydrolase